MPRRPALLLVATVLLALVSTGAGAAPVVPGMPPTDRVDTVRPGSLTVDPAAVGTWRAGPVEVSLSATGLAVRAGGRTLWTSPQDTAFVTGGRGSVSWQESRGYFWPTVEYAERLSEQTVDRVAVGGDAVVLTGQLSAGGLLPADPAAYTLRVRPLPSGGAELHVDTDAALTSVALVSGRSDGAGVHGFGEQFADFDLDGRLLPIVVREQGVGRGEEPITRLADLTNNGAGGTDQMTYAAWSTFLTEDLRGLRLDPAVPTSTAFAVADMRDGDAVGLELWAPSLTAHVVAADTPAELVAAQQAGDKRLRLARWASRGAIVGLQGGTKEVRRELKTLRKAGTKVSAVWLQDWTGHRVTSFGKRLWWTWQRDTEHYPRWRKLVADLRKQGIRTTTYVNPMLTDAAARNRPGMRNLWAEARDLGYLVRNAKGEPYEQDQGEFTATLVDLTNPAAQSWFADVIATQVLAHGVSGFMADFAEALPFDAVLHAGDAADLHNRWPTLWAQTVQLACERADQPKCVTWFRAGAPGQAAYAPLFWNGDQLVTFSREDGLASALLGTLSAGVSGWPLVHSDIGGYTSVDAVLKNYVRTEELLARWAEYAAFGVVMRTHEGNRPDQNPHVFSNKRTADAFARMTRLFAALKPYRKRVVDEAVTTGVPAIRPTWLVAPGTAAAESDRQFFLGEHVLVAPVLTEGATSVAVALPPGGWVHLLTGKKYVGDRTLDVAAPLGRPAAFARVKGPWTKRLQTRIEKAGF